MKQTPLQLVISKKVWITIRGLNVGHNWWLNQQILGALFSIPLNFLLSVKEKNCCKCIKYVLSTVQQFLQSVKKKKMLQVYKICGCSTFSIGHKASKAKFFVDGTIVGKVNVMEF